MLLLSDLSCSSTYERNNHGPNKRIDGEMDTRPRTSPSHISQAKYLPRTRIGHGEVLVLLPILALRERVAEFERFCRKAKTMMKARDLFKWLRQAFTTSKLPCVGNRARECETSSKSVPKVSKSASCQRIQSSKCSSKSRQHCRCFEDLPKKLQQAVRVRHIRHSKVVSLCFHVSTLCTG